MADKDEIIAQLQAQVLALSMKTPEKSKTISIKDYKKKAIRPVMERLCDPKVVGMIPTSPKWALAVYFESLDAKLQADIMDALKDEPRGGHSAKKPMSDKKADK